VKLTTPTAQLLQARLGETDLATLIDELRARGESWERISRDLNSRTGLWVSGETIRNWVEIEGE